MSRHATANPGSIETAGNLLRESRYSALRQICCEVCAGVLILRGRVSSYYLKQVAQTVVARAEGVQRIDNQIEVV
jgi:osmotically-inducible protein OsmY